MDAAKTFVEVLIGSVHGVGLASDALLCSRFEEPNFEVFPAQEVACRLTIKQNRLHIAADLPYVPETQRSALLEKVQDDLRELFTKQFGYSTEYYLTASFQSDKN